MKKFLTNWAWVFFTLPIMILVVLVWVLFLYSFATWDWSNWLSLEFWGTFNPIKYMVTRILLLCWIFMSAVIAGAGK